MVDVQPIGGTIGLHDANIYAAQIHVPALADTAWGRFAAVNLKQANMPFRALIGRNFLRNYELTYEGPTGHVTIRRST